MTYAEIISDMNESRLKSVKPGFWAKTYGVTTEVITECVEKRWAELLRDRPEAQGD